MSHRKDEQEPDEDLQAIMDAAWVHTREKVFKKKRNSVATKHLKPGEEESHAVG